MNENQQITADAVDTGEKPAARVRNPTTELILLALLFSIVAAVSLGVAWQLENIRAERARLRAESTPKPVFNEPAFVPEFSLVDQNERPVTLADLHDQVWVASFFFTSCPAQCPMMNMKMRKIHRALPQGAAAKLVSITVDPDNDSPEVLREYAKAFGNQDERWIFLTGDKQAIIHLARDGFKLPATDDPNVHSLRLVLVDRNAQIRGYFDSTDDDSVQKLQQQITDLLAERRP
jgi:protein SCO1/2